MHSFALITIIKNHSVHFVAVEERKKKRLQQEIVFLNNIMLPIRVPSCIKIEANFEIFYVNNLCKVNS